MAKTMQCNVVSAEESIFEGEVTMLIGAGSEGDLGITPGHAPLITALQPGPVRVIYDGGEEDVFYVSGGFLEVVPGVVTVLADTALRAHDLDEAAALESQERVRKEMAEQSAEFDYGRAQLELAEAAGRLRVLQQMRRRRS